MFELFLDQCNTLGRRDIALESYATLDWLNCVQINTDLDTGHGHVLGSDLKPTAGRSAQIDANL